MILLDVNVLVAAHRSDHSHHPVARPWLDELQRSGRDFGAPVEVWTSFVRVSTDRRIYSPPASLAEAFAFVKAVRSQRGYRPIGPGPLHDRLFEEVCLAADASGKLVPDAFLAAVAIENAASVASFDRDFARFDDLDWVIPAVP